MPRPRSQRRYDILKAIRANPRATLRELAAETGIKSQSNIAYHLRILEQEGLIHRPKRLARAISLPGMKRVGKGRKYNSQETRAKKSAAGRKTRLVIESVGKLKRDPNLEKRIDAVVAKALRNDNDHSMDVVNSYHSLKFHSSGLKVTKLG